MDEIRVKREEILVLATSIMDLDIPERHFVHAEKMINCKDYQYSLAFYEVAKQMMDLLVSGYSLDEAVKALANRIPSVEDIQFELKWMEDDDYSTDRQNIMEHAERVLELAKEKDIDGPDIRIAKRVQGKKLSTMEWKLAALRLCDINTRIELHDRNLPEFLEDETRCEMEFAELRKHLSKVTVHPEYFHVTVRPRFPPWTDVGYWDSDFFEHGYTEAFPPPVVVQLTEIGLQEAQSAAEAQSGSVAHGGIDKEWPKLKTIPPMKQETLDKGKAKIQDPTSNVWTDRTRKKSFMNAGIAKAKLKYNPPNSAETECLIDITRAYTTKEVWGHALLGQYVGRHPGHSAIIGMMKQWKPRAKYKEEQGWMIFNFDSEEDQEEVLIGGPYLIHGRPLILKHVPDKFAFTNKDFATVPLWTRIHGLGTRFWTEEFLGNIASYVGKPLYLDPVTEGRKRHSYARVLVEINLANKVVRRVPLRFSDGDQFECPIQIENEPKFCHHCCAFGHSEKDCQFLSKAGVETGEKKQDAAVSSKSIPTDSRKAHENAKAASTVTVSGRIQPEILTAGTTKISSKNTMAAKTLKTAETEESKQVSDRTVAGHELTTMVENEQEQNGSRGSNGEGKMHQQLAPEAEIGKQGLNGDEIVVTPDRKTITAAGKLCTPAAVPPSASRIHQQHDAGPHTRGRK